MADLDVRELCRQFSSKNSLIPTRQVCDLQNQVDEWIQTNSCGGIVYGPSRCGKTSAIHFISRSFKETYGNELPVYTYTATDHIASQKAFYEGLLLMMDHEDASKGTANQMRQRLVNRITSNALGTKYQMAILWIDEAYLLSEKEFLWLIDIYNALSINDIQLTVILVGTRELLDVKKGFIRAGKQQIVQRFMLKEAEFHGIESLSDMIICMQSLDKSIVPRGYSAPICLSETYFPDAFRDGKNLASFAPDFWTAMQNLRSENGIGENYLTMKCYMDSVSYCLRKFGVQAGDNMVYMPTVTEWETSLIQSGFVSSQV